MVSEPSNMPTTNRVIQKQAEALSLEVAVDGIDIGSSPDPLAAEFMRHDASELEKTLADAFALRTKPPVGTGGELVPDGD